MLTRLQELCKSCRGSCYFIFVLGLLHVGEPVDNNTNRDTKNETAAAKQQQDDSISARVSGRSRVVQHTCNHVTCGAGGSYAGREGQGLQCAAVAMLRPKSTGLYYLR